MKRLFFTGALLMFLSTGALAQTTLDYTPAERAHIQTQWMKENLGLNSSQLLQIDTVNIEYAQKMEKVKNINGKLNKLKKARSLMGEKDEKLKRILTKDQYQLYLEKRKELRDKIREIRKSEKEE